MQTSSSFGIDNIFFNIGGIRQPIFLHIHGLKPYCVYNTLNALESLQVLTQKRERLQFKSSHPCRDSNLKCLLLIHMAYPCATVTQFSFTFLLPLLFLAAIRHFENNWKYLTLNCWPIKNICNTREWMIN